MNERTDGERLASIETSVKNIEHQLFGNGQPGEIERIHVRINGHGKRLATMENRYWWIVGICLGLGVAAGTGVSKLLELAIR